MMKILSIASLAIGIGAAFLVWQSQQNQASGSAPELHESIWLNTSSPLKLANLRGHVVLLEMWTFDCINCIHTLPTIQGWYESYADEGLVVIGNHFPEFDYEANLDNLRAAVQRYGLTYPILQDNQGETWRAYDNHYWPAIYLIDKQGQIRYFTVGEGHYERTESVMRELLAESYTGEANQEAEAVWSLSANEVVELRSGAGENFPIIARIYPNEAYYILEETNGWYRINFAGTEAYVSAENVRATGANE